MILTISSVKMLGALDFPLSLSIEIKFHTKIIHNDDPCFPANDQQTAYQSCMLHKHFDTKKFLPAIETWTIYGLDITLTAPR